LAGHVGKIVASNGKGDSLKKSCFKASSAVMRLSGSYVNNLVIETKIIK